MPHRRPSRRPAPMSRLAAAAARAASHVLGRPAGPGPGDAAADPAGGDAPGRRRPSFRAEGLEVRRLMVTFSTFGGGFDEVVFADGAGVATILEFNDVDFTVTTQIRGTTMFPNPGLGEQLSPYPVPSGGAGTDIFRIDVTASAADSYIVVTHFDTTTGHLLPFDGPAAPGVFNSAGAPAAALPGIGGVLIGGFDIGPGLNFTARADLDYINGGVEAGIYVAPTDAATGLQNDFGQVFIGGAVTGRVSFGGNLTEFYAGGIYTGVSDGGRNARGSTRPDPGNFAVAGDLRNLIAGGPVGTDGVILPTLYNPRNNPALFNYESNFDLTVGGTLGELHVGNAGRGFTSSLAGTVEVYHSDTVSGQTPYPAGTTGVLGDTAPDTEVETLAAVFPNDLFTNPALNFPNNTPDDAQILGTHPVVNAATGVRQRDASGNLIYEASVDGTYQGSNAGDGADFYGVALMAGQTVTATLTTTGNGILEVYDPDGRLVQSNVEGGDDVPIRVTADRPGIWKFAIVGSPATIPFTYNLTVANVGDLGIGGIVATGDFNDLGTDGSLATAGGDLGAISVAGTYYALTAGPTSAASESFAPVAAPSSIVASVGNVRAVVAAAMGQATPGGDALVYIDGPTFSIPNGGLGLVRTTAGVLQFNSQFDPNALALGQYVTDDAYAHAIRYGIQTIDAAGTFEGFVATDAGIGTLKAGDFNSDTPSVISVNADNAGNDGLIDLIDCEGTLGNLNTGGPSIFTHTGGHVRYMRVAGPVFLPSQFGNVQDTPATFPIGQGTTFTDDTGNQISVTPVGVTTTNTSSGVAANTSSGTSSSTSGGTTTITFSPAPGQQVVQTLDSATGTVTQTTTTGPQLSMLTYPVSDKGGSIPLFITSTGSLAITASGSTGRGSQVDLGTITIAGQGRTVVQSGVDAFGNPTLAQPLPAGTTSVAQGITPGSATNLQNVAAAGTTDPTDLFLTIGGSATVNVYNVISVETILGFVGIAANGANATITTPGTGQPVLISDVTGGEIGNVNVPAVGTIQVRGNLGFFTAQATAAAVLPQPVVGGGDSYPFVHQHTAVELGDAVNINVGGAVGNVIASDTVNNLIADAGNRPAAGLFAGIVGPVQAGRLLYVQVGQGLADTGTGGVGLSGLFATDKIGEVTNAGVTDGDIRGNIIALNIGNTTQASIDRIQLANASIVGSAILDLAGPAYLALPVTIGDAFSVGADFGLGRQIIESLDSFPTAAGGRSQYDIPAISVGGNGGILGSTIVAGSVGPITVGAGGFGVIESSIEGLGAGRIGGITAGGYGIRQATVDNGGFVGPISATGNGASVPVTRFSAAVRPSDSLGNGGFDPFTGNPLTPLNDLNAALGGSVSAQNPSVPNVTDTGVIEDLLLSANNDIVGVSAQKIRTRLPITSTNVVPAPSQPNVPIYGVPFSDSISTAGRIGYVRVRQLIDGLQITAAGIGQFTQTGNVNRLGIAVSGRLNSLTIRGNLGTIIADPATGLPIGDSYIYANGRSGSIGTLNVLGSLYANVLTTGSIGRINVAGDLVGTLTAQGNASRQGLGSLTVGGTIRNGTLNVAGQTGTITTGGSLGTAGQTLTIAGGVNRLLVGSRRAAGTQLALNLTVDGPVGSLQVNGRITGAVHVLGSVNTLTVNGDATSPDAVTGAIQVDGRLNRATINNGNLAANLTVNADLTNLTINRGSINAGATVLDQVGSIRTVRVLGGLTFGIAGSVLAPAGTNLNVTTTGNVGGGASPAVIQSTTGGVISIAGSVLSNATVTFSGPVNSLFVGGNVSAGAVVAGHPFRRHTVRGITAGTLVTA